MDTVILGTLIKKMNRGLLMKSSEMESIISYTQTPYEYLKIGNIENGLITGEPTYLKSIDDKLMKYCIQNNNLVITKTGLPHKLFVAQNVNDRYIIANGNLFFIELDLDKVDPFYLASYLNSDKGKIQLMDASCGELLPSMNVSKFKAMEIPLPDMDEQHRIGKIYQDILQNIEKYNQQLALEIDKLNHIL